LALLWQVILCLKASDEQAGVGDSGHLMWTPEVRQGLCHPAHRQSEQTSGYSILSGQTLISQKQFTVLLLFYEMIFLLILFNIKTNYCCG